MQFNPSAPGLNSESFVAQCCMRGMIIGVSKSGDNVWELAEWAPAAVGAPLALLCILIPFAKHDRLAAGCSAIVSQITFLLTSEEEVAFILSLALGGSVYACMLLMT